MKVQYHASAAEGEVGYKMQTIGVTSRAHLFVQELKGIHLPSQNSVPKSGSLHISKNFDGSTTFQGSQTELRSEPMTRSQDTAVAIREQQVLALTSCQSLPGTCRTK